MQQVLALALSHLRAGDEDMAFRVGGNLIDAPEDRAGFLNWAYSLIAFDEARR